MTSLFKRPDEKGQGLVEYALILVLVAIVVIAILLLLGPAVSQVYCKVTNALQPGECGVISSVSAEWVGNELVTTVEVMEDTSITYTTNSASGTATGSVTCTPSSCTVNIPVGGTGGIGTEPGTVTVEADGSSMSTSYPHK